MLTRLVCQDLLAAGTALNRIGVDGDGIVWLSECGAMPRHSGRRPDRPRPGRGLPVLAATTSAQVAADLADMVNVVVVHRMEETARQRDWPRSHPTRSRTGIPLRPARPDLGPRRGCVTANSCWR